MKKIKKTNVIKMLIVALGICMLFGSSVLAYADGDETATAPGRDLVGRGTAINATVADAGQTPTVQPKGTQDPATTTAVDAVNTGMIDQLYPFITMLAINFALFALFVHLRLNQSRYGRSQAHYREIDDFHWRMQHLDD